MEDNYFYMQKLGEINIVSTSIFGV